LLTAPAPETKTKTKKTTKKTQYVAEGTASPRTVPPPRQVKDYAVDLTGLDPSTQYKFLVRAVNTKNGASSSAEVRATTPAAQPRCDGPPRPPSNLKARSDSPTTLTVTWEGVANDPCIARYEVTYIVAGSTVSPKALSPVYSTQTTVTLSGLTPSTEYSIVVAAVSPNGQRSTVATNARTQPQCSSPVRAPGSPNAKQTGARALRLTWSNGANPSGCVGQTQAYWADTSGSGARGPTVSLGASASEVTFNDLQPGREYALYVRYLGKDSVASPWSSARVFLPNNSQGGTVAVPAGRR
jgi:chitodextrinase